MKGAGETISTLVMIITVVLIFSILVSDAFSGAIKRQRIVLEETELFKVKNTFLLVNKSLAETWRLSTIQSIFQAADGSVGCGFDERGKNLRIGAKYWLRTPADSGGTTNRLEVQIAPDEDEKYNTRATPVICGPKRKHLNELLNSRMSEVIGPKAFRFTVNDLEVNVRGVKSVVEAADDKAVSTTAYEIEVPADCPGASCAKTETKNVSGIVTDIGKMVDVGRNMIYEGGRIRAGQGEPFTGSLLGYSRAFIRFLFDEFGQYDNPEYIFAFKYQDVFADSVFGLPVTPGKDAYLNDHRGFLSSVILSERDASGRVRLRKDGLKNSDIQVSFKTLEPITACHSNRRACEAGEARMLLDGTGLLLHYDLTITITDNSQYYQHTDENKFEKKPVKLEIKAEDYLPALDCTEPGILEEIQRKNNNNRDLQRVFNWEQGKRQLMCFQGLLYSCGDLNIPNFPAGNIKSVGEKVANSKYRCTESGFVIS